MFHKTLKSYDSNDPFNIEEDHPDGSLWLLTPEELAAIPKGVTLEDTFGNQFVVGKDTIDTEKTYGIRGHREL